MNPIPIQSSAFSASEVYSPTGSKLMQIQVYDADSPTSSFELKIRVGDATTTQVLTYTFIGIRNGRKVSVSHLTPAICAYNATTTSSGQASASVTPLGGSSVRLYYAKST